MTGCIFTINAGSSSIKFGMFEANESLAQIFKGSIRGIGGKSSTFQIDDEVQEIVIADHKAAIHLLIERIQVHGSQLIAIGHRIVHGGPKYSSSQVINREVIETLRGLTLFAPDHLPEELLLIEAFEKRFPTIAQWACFDTSFHHNLPTVAKLLPIPRRYEAEGVRRYGFHGLSCEFLMKVLESLGSAKGRIILAHLGSGASLTAVHNGKSIDTSMSFTPTAGVPMNTRSGDLDPGLFGYLAATHGFGAKEFSEMANCKSGLLGLSEISSDIKELLRLEPSDHRASEATSLFCYQIKKWIGAFAAALGGVDTLVFSGGIGENSPIIRERICRGLEFLGIELEKQKNQENGKEISMASSRVIVRVIPTNEEWMIAKTIYLGMQK
jgi:acetate kinase